MKDKEKQLVNDLVEIFDNEYQERRLLTPTFTAKQLCKLGYQKLLEDSVIISQKEYDALKTIEKYHIKSCGKDSVVLSREEWKRIKNSLYYSKEELDKKLAKASNETAEKILDFIQENRHKYEMWYLVSELRKFFGIEQNNDWVFGDLADELNNKFVVEIKEN